MNSNVGIKSYHFLCRFFSFGVAKDKDVESSVFLAFLMLDLEIELFDQFFPISVGEVSASHEIVAPFYILVVVELHDA